MKKSGVVLLSFAFILIGVFILFYINYSNLEVTGNVIFSPSGCSDSQTILKLYSANNSHGELWNSADYPSAIRICYDQLFGKNYSGLNPHNCTTTNKVIGLSSSTNAHAEAPNQTNYNQNYNVCYGNLSCQYIQNASNCSSLGANYSEVISLSGITNAHLAIPGSYNNQICCSESSGGTIIIPNGSAPIARISSPSPGDIYFVNDIVSFNQTSYDPEGSNLAYEWSISEGSSRNEENFTYQYQNTGLKRVTLKVTNNASMSSQDSVVILIARIGTNVYPEIDSPAEGSDITDMNVGYDGASSYALNITNSSSGYSFECLGGGCPANVSGYCGTNCATINDPFNKIGNYSKMNFTWSFGNDLATAQSGLGIKSGNVRYYSSGPQIISLLLQYSGISESTFNNFIISGNSENGCRDNGLHYWDGSNILDTLNANTPCKDLGAGISQANCCPSQYSCVTGGSSGSYCSNACNNIYTDSNGDAAAIDLCGLYNNVSESLTDRQNHCIDDCAGARVHNSEIIQLPFGQNFDVHRCAWSDDNESCYFFYNTTITSYAGGFPITTGANNGTLWNLLGNGGCQDGYQTITWCENNGTLNNNLITSTGTCSDPQTMQVPCETGKIDLPFFGIWQLISSAISVLVVYLFYKKRDDKN